MAKLAPRVASKFSKDAIVMTLSRIIFVPSSVMVESDTLPSFAENFILSTLKTISDGKCLSVREYIPFMRLAVSLVCAMMTEFHPSFTKSCTHAMYSCTSVEPPHCLAFRRISLMGFPLLLMLSSFSRRMICG